MAYCTIDHHLAMDINSSSRNQRSLQEFWVVAHLHGYQLSAGAYKFAMFCTKCRLHVVECNGWQEKIRIKSNVEWYQNHVFPAVAH